MTDLMLWKEISKLQLLTSSFFHYLCLLFDCGGDTWERFTVFLNLCYFSVFSSNFTDVFTNVNNLYISFTVFAITVFMSFSFSFPSSLISTISLLLHIFLVTLVSSNCNGLNIKDKRRFYQRLICVEYLSPIPCGL